MSVLASETLLAFVPFRMFSEARLDALLKFCSRLYLRKGQVLLEPGSLQTHVYFLISGQLKFEKSDEILNAAFAYAIDYKCQHQDTVRALTDCSLFQVERDTLERFVSWAQVSSYLVQDIAYQRQYDDKAEWMKILLQSNLFYKVSPLNLQKIFLHMTPMPVTQGQTIITQGEMGDCCYFIKRGLATVTRVMAGETAPKVLAEMGLGRCVGEDALLHEAVRNATVTMATDGLLMKMDKRDFVQLLREPSVDTVTSSDLDMVLQTGAVLLDVRTEEEFQYNHLSGAISMSLDLLRVKLRLLDPYKLYVIYCDSDRRSKAATYLLEQHGIRARALLGGLNNIPPEQKQALLAK